MSTLKVDGIRSNSATSDAITLASDGTCTANITNNLSNRNLIINGAMQVAQRGTTDSGSATTAFYPTADRWRIVASNTDNASFNFSMPSDTPTGQGFTRSWKVDVGTAETSLDSNELFYYTQILEGQDVQQLAYGTSSAKSITLSFWVKAYQAGTYTCSIYKADQTARGVKINYTINASATWEFKTITFSGDTGGGGIDNDNGAGLFVHWVLAAGSNYTSSNSMDSSWANYDGTSFAHGQTVNIMSSTDNYWQITGVQLEVGSHATDFEHRSYGQELALCQRYYYRWTAGAAGRYVWMGQSYSTSTCFGIIKTLPVTMRAAPTSTVSGTFTPYGDNGSVSGHDPFSNTNIDQNNKDQIATGGWSGATGVDGGGRAVVVRATEAAAYIDASAEL